MRQAKSSAHQPMAVMPSNSFSMSRYEAGISLGGVDKFRPSRNAHLRTLECLQTKKPSFFRVAGLIRPFSVSVRSGSEYHAIDACFPDSYCRPLADFHPPLLGPSKMTSQISGSLCRKPTDYNVVTRQQDRVGNRPKATEGKANDAYQREQQDTWDCR